MRALRERPTQLRRFPGRDRGRADLPEARAREAPRVDRGGAGHVPVGPACRRALRHRAGPGRLGREPRRDRLPPLALPARRHRASRRAADRHRPAAGHRLRRRQGASRRSCARRSPRSATRAGRRRRATAASTSPAGSSRGGSSRSSAAPRSRSRARSSAARPSSSRRPGGRRSGARRCSSTTTRTPATARSPRPTRCGRGPTPPCRRPSPGTSCPTSRPRTSRSSRCRRASRSSATCRPRSTTPSATCGCCSSGSSATRRPASARRRIRRTSRRCRASRRACSRRAREEGEKPSRVSRRPDAASPRASSLATVSPPGSRGGRSSAQVHCARILVRPEPQQLRPVPEPIALHLVVAHLRHELGPQRLLLEPAAAPAVRLARSAGRTPRRAAAAPARRSRRGARRDGRRADVVDLAVVVVEPEQQRRDLPVRPSTSSARPTTTQSAVRSGLTLTTAPRPPGSTGASSRFATTPSRPSCSSSSSQAVAASGSATDGERSNAAASRSSAARRSDERPLPHRCPSQTSTSKPTNRAGISPESLLMRLSAGWRRVCIASKSIAPSISITISPSIAERGGSRSPSGRSSGK